MVVGPQKAMMTNVTVATNTSVVRKTIGQILLTNAIGLGGMLMISYPI